MAVFKAMQKKQKISSRRGGTKAQRYRKAKPSKGQDYHILFFGKTLRVLCPARGTSLRAALSFWFQIFRFELIGGLVFIFVILAFINANAQSVSVPLDHPVYDFLERMEAYHAVSPFALRVQPISRAEVLQMLQSADSSLAGFLTPAEKSRLQRYLSEFTDPAIGKPAPREAEPHLLRLEENNSQIFIDALATQEFEFRRGGLIGEKNISRTLAGLRLRGTLSGRLGFFLEGTNTLERGDDEAQEDFRPGAGAPVTLSGSSAFKGQAMAAFFFRVPWACIEIGRDQLTWGSGPATQLGLSRRNLPVDLLRLQIIWRRFQFTYIHANLRADRRRYFAGHRLDVALGTRGRVGVYEGVIYGGRDVEFQYLNPLMPYHIAEHLLGDRDNNVLGIDFSFYPHRGKKIYGEIFVDDLSLEFPIGTYWGNKLAYHFGAFIARPLGWRDADLRMEYTRVDPFVYTHDDSVNVYAHNGESLGSRLGPNADRFSVMLAYQPHRDVRFNATYLHDRQGKGDLLTPHQEVDGNSKGFLKGALETANQWRAGMSVQIHRDVYVDLDFGWRRVKNVERKIGRDENLRQALFALRANY